MYNGIGLTTARGSGTNGHVQRNFAFVRPGKKDNIKYKTEDDLAKLEASTNRQPNIEILEHERKRKIEVKCAEFEDALEKQGFSEEEIQQKVESFRNNMTSSTNEDNEKDENGRLILRETHQIAEAQQEKNAKLREAFGISEYFVEGREKSANSERELPIPPKSKEKDEVSEKKDKKKKRKRNRDASSSPEPERKNHKKKKSKKNKSRK